MKNTKTITWVLIIVAILAAVFGIVMWRTKSSKTSSMIYEEFKSLTAEEQVAAFNNMTGPEI